MNQGHQASLLYLVISSGHVGYLDVPRITFPSAARRDVEHGIVLLLMVIDQCGKVVRVTVHQPSGYKRLDDAAVSCLFNARFHPHMRDGIALPIEVRVPVEFSLPKRN